VLDIGVESLLVACVHGLGHGADDALDIGQSLLAEPLGGEQAADELLDGGFVGGFGDSGEVTVVHGSDRREQMASMSCAGADKGAFLLELGLHQEQIEDVFDELFIRDNMTLR
jgi:hypothetical protein